MNQHEGHSHDVHAAAATGQAVKDPVCGMSVNPKSAIQHEFDGKTYHFCSEHCLNKFQAEPSKYEPSDG